LTIHRSLAEGTAQHITCRPSRKLASLFHHPFFLLFLSDGPGIQPKAAHEYHISGIIKSFISKTPIIPSPLNCPQDSPTTEERIILVFFFEVAHPNTKEIINVTRDTSDVQRYLNQPPHISGHKTFKEKVVN
jgi:hypothetical protein